MGSVWQNFSEQNIFCPWLLVFLKWTNTNAVGELNNENLHQIIMNVTVIGNVSSWIMGEELEIPRASGSAGIPVLIMESLDEPLYWKRKAYQKHTLHHKQWVLWDRLSCFSNFGNCTRDSDIAWKGCWLLIWISVEDSGLSLLVLLLNHIFLIWKKNSGSRLVC